MAPDSVIPADDRIIQPWRSGIESAAAKPGRRIAARRIRDGVMPWPLHDLWYKTPAARPPALPELSAWSAYGQGTGGKTAGATRVKRVVSIRYKINTRLRATLGSR
jgi:hypothetical protein